MSLSTRYISDYLAQHKTVSLEKIGKLSLPQSASTDEEGNPVDQSLFVYNKKAVTTPEFVDYLAEVTQKSRSIAQSDLEYFLDQARQLMNIGSTPLVIEGLGFIYAEKNGEYALNTKDIQEVKEKERKSYEDNYNNSPLTSATNYATHRPSKRLIGRWILILLIIGVIVYGAYFFPKSSFKLFSSNVADTVATATDSTAKKSTSSTLQNTTEKARKEGEYRFIFQTFDNKEDADKRTRQLKSYGNIVFIDSSKKGTGVTYSLYVQMENVQTTDTTRIKDSLRGYYGHPVVID